MGLLKRITSEKNSSVFGGNAEKLTVIIGCGRLGSSVAGKLSDNGENVVVIDKDNKSFRRLSSSYGGLTVVGDGTDTHLLKENNVEDATTLIAATDNDNINIMIGQMAKVEFNIPKVIIRLYSNECKAIYENMDIDVICPSDLSTEAIDNILAGGTK